MSHKPGGIGCHYFPSGLQLPSQSLRGLLPISLLVNRGTMGVNSLPKRASRLRFEPRPFCTRVQHANHSVTEPPCSLPYYADRAHGEKRKATLWCLSRLLSNVSAAMIYCIYCLQAMPRPACLSVHYRAMVTIEQCQETSCWKSNPLVSQRGRGPPEWTERAGISSVRDLVGLGRRSSATVVGPGQCFFVKEYFPVRIF